MLVLQLAVPQRLPDDLVEAYTRAGEEMATRAAAEVMAARPLRLVGPARNIPGIQVAR